MTGVPAAGLVCALIGATALAVIRMRDSQIARRSPEMAGLLRERYAKRVKYLSVTLPIFWASLLRMAGFDADFTRYAAVAVGVLGLAFACFLPTLWLFKLRYGISVNDEATRDKLGMALFFVALWGVAMALFAWGLMTAEDMGLIHGGL